jgi:hypothetical protein
MVNANRLLDALLRMGEGAILLLTRSEFALVSADLVELLKILLKHHVVNLLKELDSGHFACVEYQRNPEIEKSRSK